MARSTNPRKFLTEAEIAGINASIKRAERNTSAEVKVVLARHCWGSLEAKARKVFGALGLADTQERNCVLLLLIVTNREFLVYGDEGIHAKVGLDFWNEVGDEMAKAFGEDRFGEGIALAVQRAGEKLAQFFPHRRDDIDEISNEIVYRR